jgi:hypothetical protein
MFELYQVVHFSRSSPPYMGRNRLERSTAQCEGIFHKGIFKPKGRRCCCEGMYSRYCLRRGAVAN